LAHKALICNSAVTRYCHSKTNVVRRLNVTALCSTVGIESIYHGITLHLSPFWIWRIIPLASNDPLCCMKVRHVAAMQNPAQSEGWLYSKWFNLWIKCVFHRVTLHLSSFSISGKISFGSHCSCVLYGRRLCNFHPQTNLVRRFNVLHMIYYGSWIRIS
jgi:hypothetical protein